jgi:hypothetical protein
MRCKACQDFVRTPACACYSCLGMRRRLHVVLHVLDIFSVVCLTPIKHSTMVLAWGLCAGGWLLWARCSYYTSGIGRRLVAGVILRRDFWGAMRQNCARAREGVLRYLQTAQLRCANGCSAADVRRLLCVVEDVVRAMCGAGSCFGR